MLRQSAFENRNKMLKGSLHCHTTRSDGNLTPEETLARYKELGYSFVCIADHNIYNTKNFGSELTVICGAEHDDYFEWDALGYRCFHTVLLGNKETTLLLQDEKLPKGEAKSQEEYQKYLDGFHSKNNMTMLCHPQWSNTPAKYFEKLKGNFAMELFNGAAAMDNDMDHNAAYWDEMLGQDIKIWGVASDDAHRYEHFGQGWVMVNSENNTAAILDALKNGRFYSSCGPEIYDFYMDGSVAHIKCSEASSVSFIDDRHTGKRFNGVGITEKEFDLATLAPKPGTYKYIRACVIDKNGKRAWTNPIFFNE